MKKPRIYFNSCDMLLKRIQEMNVIIQTPDNSRRFYLLYPQIGNLFGKSPTLSDLLGTEVEWQRICKNNSSTSPCISMWM